MLPKLTVRVHPTVTFLQLLVLVKTERTELDLEGSEEQVMWSEDINFDEESRQEVIPEGA